MHHVKHAIIMAAGVGKRMQPITLSTPKPLVKVHGISMIETIIEALHQNSIHSIFIVVGYLKEQFQSLKSKYSGITFIENPYADYCNNISSLYVARDYLSESMIIDGDQIIRNPGILSPEFTRSGYNCVWTSKPTHEWLLTVKNGVVTQCSRTGGLQGWQLFSISRWNDLDGLKLKNHVEIEFVQNGNTQLYWDDLALFCYPQEYELGIREMDQNSVLEVDTYEELLAIETSYIKDKKE